MRTLYSISVWGTNLTIRGKNSISESEVTDIINPYLEAYEITFSKFISSSEINNINIGSTNIDDASNLFLILNNLAERLKSLTGGKFNHKIGDLYDFNSIAKGHIVDLLADKIYAEHGDILLNFGGDIAVRGASTFKVAIESPRLDRSAICILDLNNAGVATSGDYYRPGHLNSKYDSTTVYGPSTAVCDALSTALSLTPIEEIDYLPQEYRAVIYPDMNSNFYYSL